MRHFAAKKASVARLVIVAQPFPTLVAAWGSSAKARAKRGAALFGGSSVPTPLSTSEEDGIGLHSGMQCALEGVRQKLEVRSAVRSFGNVSRLLF